VWYDNIKAVLQGFEFVRCESDHSIFVNVRNGYLIYLAVYMDDLLSVDYGAEEGGYRGGQGPSQESILDEGLGNRQAIPWHEYRV